MLVQLAIEEASDQMIVKLVFTGMKVVAENPFDFPCYNEVGLKIQPGKEFIELESDFRQIILCMKRDLRLLD